MLNPQSDVLRSETFISPTQILPVLVGPDKPPIICFDTNRIFLIHKVTFCRSGLSGHYIIEPHKRELFDLSKENNYEETECRKEIRIMVDPVTHFS